MDSADEDPRSFSRATSNFFNRSSISFSQLASNTANYSALNASTKSNDLVADEGFQFVIPRLNKRDKNFSLNLYQITNNVDKNGEELDMTTRQLLEYLLHDMSMKEESPARQTMANVDERNLEGSILK